MSSRRDGEGSAEAGIAIPVSAAWLLLAAYCGATGATSFDLIAITALVTSPAVGWTWHWVMEKPS